MPKSQYDGGSSSFVISSPQACLGLCLFDKQTLTKYSQGKVHTRAWCRMSLGNLMLLVLELALNGVELYNYQATWPAALILWHQRSLP